MERLKGEIIYIESELYKCVSHEYELGCPGCCFLSENEFGFMTCNKPRCTFYECENIIYEKIC